MASVGLEFSRAARTEGDVWDFLWGRWRGSAGLGPGGLVR